MGYTATSFHSFFLLAKRKRLALEPLYLGSLYARLDECVHNIFRLVIDLMSMLMPTHPFFKCFYAKDLGLCPLGQLNLRLLN